MISASQIPIRNYNKLYLGSNEKDGYESPFLSFGTETKEIIFKPDLITRFVYPEYAYPEHISITELIEDGAVWGAVPEHADRIKTSTDCLEGGANSMYDRYGAFAFTWLSGNGLDPNQTPIWVDRWYNPLYKTESDAISSVPGARGIYDLPSRLRMMPNNTYDYFHYGSEINNEIVKRFDTKLNIHFDTWAETTPNQSKLHSSVVAHTVNFDTTMISNDIVDRYALLAKNEIYNTFTNDSSIRFNRDKKQFAYVDSNMSHNLSGDFTCTFWVKKDNWKTGPSTTIASHGFRSGWNVKFNNGFPPIINALSDIDGNTILYNTKNNVYGNINIYKSTVTRIIDSVIDNDYYLFTLFEDTDGKVSIHKIDMVSGLVTRKYTFNNTIPPSATYKLLLSPQESLYIIGATFYYEIDRNLATDPISRASAFAGSIYSTLNLQGDVISPGNFTTFDEQGNQWQIDNNNITKNGIPIFITLDEYVPASIRFDSNNRLWALCIDSSSSRGHVKKYNIDLVDRYLEDDYRYLQFLKELQTDDLDIESAGDFVITRNSSNDKNILIVYSDVDKKLYYFYENGTTPFDSNRTDILLYSATNFLLFLNNNYDWNRKFNYIKYNKEPTLQLNVYTKDKDVRLAQNTEITKHTFNLQSSKLIDSGGWHHIAFNINTSNNFISFFVDTLLTTSLSIEPNQNMACIYDCPIVFGTAAGPVLELAREFKDDTIGYFNGNIDDFRLYNTNIIQDQSSDQYKRYIERIYLEKFTYYNLHWNIKVPETFYVEEIQHFFKFKPPGNKSQFFNIKIRNLHINDEETRLLIESIIKDSLKKTIPHYAYLYKILWE